MKTHLIYMVVILVGLVAPMAALSQKGTGDTRGIAQQALDLPIMTVSGVLLEIKTGPCEKTTGKSPYGTHLIVEREGSPLNIHLGPVTAVDHAVNQLALGTQITLDVFRTDSLAKNAYIAKSIKLEDKIVHLRDENLRPSWAASFPGRGQGKGRGVKGVDRRRGPCW